MAQSDLESLASVYQELSESPMIYHLDLSQRQRVVSAFELRKEQLRRRWAEQIRARLEQVEGLAELEALWRRIKAEVQAKRRLIGPRIERRVAAWMDWKERELRERDSS